MNPPAYMDIKSYSIFVYAESIEETHGMDETQ